MHHVIFKVLPMPSVNQQTVIKTALEKITQDYERNNIPIEPHIHYEADEMVIGITMSRWVSVQDAFNIGLAIGTSLSFMQEGEARHG